MSFLDNYQGFPPLEALRGWSVDETALLMIDVQRFFCDLDYSKVSGMGTAATKDVADNIADHILPLARERSLRSIFIYCVEPSRSRIDMKEYPHVQYGGFYKIRPQSGDNLAFKTTDSAFWSGPLYSTLQTLSVKNLLVTGFNAGACVMKTVKDALELKYNVCVLSDGVGNGDIICMQNLHYDLTQMEEAGALVLSSCDVFGALEPSDLRIA